MHVVIGHPLPLYCMKTREIHKCNIFMGKVMYTEISNPLMWWKWFSQFKENTTHNKTPPAHTQATQSSMKSPLDSAERPPMIEISNKLHAMVDEFVSNLSSECSSLANNISSQALMYAALDTGAQAAKAPRPSNRTTTEVLNGLKRPSSDIAKDSSHRVEKTHMEHGTPNLEKGSSRNRVGGRYARQPREKKPRSSTLEGNGIPHDVTSVDIDSDNTLSKSESEHGQGTYDMAAIGKSMHTIEILSSDQSSDDWVKTKRKHSRKPMVKQSNTKITNRSSRGRSTGLDFKSPSRSPESSHLMNYSYEEDTNSPVGRSPAIESTFPKLRWPKDVDTVHEGGNGTKTEINSAHGNSESRKNIERKNDDDNKRLHEGDELNSEDPDGNETGGETDGEELPVLPKAPVKRKLMSEPRSAERSTQRGRTKSGNLQTKKQRTPIIDASVITQLEFGKRPPNCVSIGTLSLCVFCMMRLGHVVRIEVQQVNPLMPRYRLTCVLHFYAVESNKG